MRGDNELTVNSSVPVFGSPPHAWGQREKGAIPAAMKKVHPHMRGDNDLRPGGRYGQVGSPPHAWGQLTNFILGVNRLRFTPTCVGTTAFSENDEDEDEVHPHMRGDNGL